MEWAGSLTLLLKTERYLRRTQGGSSGRDSPRTCCSRPCFERMSAGVCHGEWSGEENKEDIRKEIDV